MNKQETLKAIKAVIDTPAKWTKGQLAKDARGRRIATSSPDAVCFCIFGAIDRVVTDTRARMDYDNYIFDQVAKLYPEIAGGLSDFNDAREIGHADVMKVLDRAIANAALGGTGT